jgi:O-antigen/teichoic acid export membrane protein
MAMVMAYEDLGICAFVTIVEALLKLGIAFLLRLDLLNKFQLYGILLSSVTFISMIIYLIVCNLKYHECNIGFYWNKGLFKEIADYTLFNLLGAVAFVCKTQGVTILLNQFFNPIVVAARSIANSVQNSVIYFSYNFSIALCPQIIKSYAAEEKTRMFSLVFQGMKGTYFLMYLFVLPAILETPQLLLLWLKNPPDYAAGFSRLLLLDALIQSTGYPIGAAIQATGKIRLCSLISSFFCVLNLPLSGLILLTGAPVYSVYIIAVFLTFITFFIQLVITSNLISLSLRCFFESVFLPLAGMTILSAILPVFLYFHLAPGFLRLCIITAVSLFMTCGCMFMIGLNNEEKEKIATMILKKFDRN